MKLAGQPGMAEYVSLDRDTAQAVAVQTKRNDL